jgi:hypothetical protein
MDRLHEGRWLDSRFPRSALGLEVALAILAGRIPLGSGSWVSTLCTWFLGLIYPERDFQLCWLEHPFSKREVVSSILSGSKD